jgi:hypothetical protein
LGKESGERNFSCSDEVVLSKNVFVPDFETNYVFVGSTKTEFGVPGWVLVAAFHGRSSLDVIADNDLDERVHFAEEFGAVGETG